MQLDTLCRPPPTAPKFYSAACGHSKAQECSFGLELWPLERIICTCNGEAGVVRVATRRQNSRAAGRNNIPRSCRLGSIPDAALVPPLWHTHRFTRLTSLCIHLHFVISYSGPAATAESLYSIFYTPCSNRMRSPCRPAAILWRNCR